MAKAEKITFLSPELTWVIHGINKIQCKRVYLDHVVMNDFDPIDLEAIKKHIASEGLFCPNPDFLERDVWIEEAKSASQEYDPSDLVTALDGFLYYSPTQKGGTSREHKRAIVPVKRREEFVLWHHKQLCHASHRKVYNHLKGNYHFPKMASICAKAINNCALCQLLVANRNLAHRHFRAKLFITPRTSYAMDYIGVYKNKEGYCNILGIIDLATKNLVLRAVKNRDAVSTAQTWLYDVIAHKGFPLLHSDHAREFISTAMESLCAIAGCSQTTTKAHKPQGNATIERVWAYVHKCLTQMNKEQYGKFHLYLPMVALAWNCTDNAITGISPFEAEHGMKPRTAAETFLETPPDSGLTSSRGGRP